MSRHSKLITAVASFSLMVAGPAAAAAQASTPVYSPWAALSAVASQGSSQALCGAAVAGAAAASAAAQGAAAPGCVLPAVDAPPAPVAENAPLTTPAAAVAGGGIGLLPLLLGLGALGGLAALLLANGDGEDEVGVSPR
jgi:hypothetical protein